MKVLIDTHAFLWMVTADTRLSPKASRVLTNGSNELLISAATAWEIMLKWGVGKLKLVGGPTAFLEEQLAENDIRVIPVEPAHVFRIEGLPAIHQDPFDRLLVAQAIEEDVPILTADAAVQRYPVKAIW